MKKLTNLATFAMVAVLAFGMVAAEANGGIIIHDVQGTETCTASETKVEDEKSDVGIIIHDIGIIIHDLVGILIGDFKPAEQTNCGIIIHD